MEITLNLATRRYYNKRRCRLLLVAAAGLLLLLSSIGLNRLLGAHVESDRLTVEISALDKRLTGHPSGVSEQEFTRHRQQLATLNETLAQRQHSRLALLDALEAAVPNGVAYTHIMPDQKSKQVKLEGRVRSLTVLAELLERLEATSDFHTPTLLSTEDRQQQLQPGAPSGIRFVISVGWSGP